ncbi:TATA element modulatory factor [Zalerion maritima]|uniref:TATA element modulatory factor n=1 Tax=Zalerion maritima TaxID=339359 RepID=A0AAD5RNB4_9PEZI|nr:TATA element modulatory factor [Zalerion maritima]
MSSGNKPSWGSFLSQAVAGVEARLDNILAEDEDGAANCTNGKSQPSSVKGTIPKQQPSPAVSRAASTSSRTTDRLQQRLQKAIAAKAATAGSPRQSTDLSRQSSDRARESLDYPGLSADHSTQSAPDSPSLDDDKESAAKERGGGNKAVAEGTDKNAEGKDESDAKEDKSLDHKLEAEPAFPAEVPEIKVSEEPELDLVPQEAPQLEAVNSNTNSKVVAALMDELDRLKSALQVKERQASNLEAKLQKVMTSLEAANNKVRAAAASENDRKAIRELEETVASLEVEKRLAADRAKRQLAELKERADRATQNANKVELESKAELLAMESRLEAVRSQAEEVTTSPQADSEAKLLRQLQNLQAQHASASANWQGIETTMLSRISSIENERDEALHRESEMRKKARDAAARAERQEEELEDARLSTPNMDHINSQHKAQADRLTERAEMAEMALAEARAEIEKQKQALDEEKRKRPDNERRAWLEDLPQTYRPGTSSGLGSPQLIVPSRTFSSDYLGASPLPVKARKPSSPSSNGEAGQMVPPRRPSALSYIQSMVSSTGGGQTASLVYGSTFGDAETPPVPPDDKDEMSDPIESIAAPAHGMPDVASISTIAAGPSVQLVERMSAAIRRLESEKVAAREELGRISSQRDEARGEMVTLMKEIESNKAAVEKVADLESQVEEINQRYQTTLELLGEKSELVDELKADVEDVKQMYRELVERTHPRRLRSALRSTMEDDGDKYAAHAAAREGNLTTFQHLLEDKPKLATLEDPDGRVPLHWACSSNSYPIALYLSTLKSFDPDVQDASGWTPLMIAGSVQDADSLVGLLLARDADVNMTTNGGQSIMHFVASKGNLHLARKLLAQKPKPASARIRDNRGLYPIHRAAAAGHTVLVKLLIEAGRSPLDATDQAGYTALHHAVAEGHGDTAVLLLQNGADATKKDVDGTLAIDLAPDTSVKKFIHQQAEREGISL